MKLRSESNDSTTSSQHPVTCSYFVGCVRPVCVAVLGVTLRKSVEYFANLNISTLIATICCEDDWADP